MKFITYVILVCIFIIYCSKRDLIKPSQKDIDEYIITSPPVFGPRDKKIVYDPRFEVGMRQEEVVKILGEPDTIEIIQQPWAKQEKWIYKKEKYVFYIEDGGVVGVEKL